MRPARGNLQYLANVVARQHGYWRATDYTFDEAVKNPTINTGACLPCGYRKYTTGEYVRNAYRHNFGWKNTYYQPATCVVVFPLWLV